MVQFHNGEPGNYVTINQSAPSDPKMVKYTPLYGRLARKTRCRGDVLWLKIVTVVLILCVVVLIYTSSRQQENLQSLRILLTPGRMTSLNQRIKTDRIEGGCLYEGRWFNSGETFKKGCNTCKCGVVIKGAFTCTKMFCQSVDDCRNGYKTNIEGKKVLCQTPGSITESKMSLMCNFTLPVGVGVSNYTMGKLTQNECATQCKKLQSSEPLINGFVVYSDTGKPGCWCVKNLQSVISNKMYKTCMIESNVTQNYTDFQSQTKCRFAIGDAIGSKIRMGFSQTPAQCIDDCLRLQGIDAAINGASVYSDGEKKGCWCVKRLIDLDSNGAYKTCFLPNTITDPDKKATKVMGCRLTPGDGIKGSGKVTSQLQIKLLNNTKCVQACIKMKVFNVAINGVTVPSNRNEAGCWCNLDMVAINDNARFSTCFIEENTTQVSQPVTDPRCPFKVGGMTGGYDINIGLLGEKKCIDACMKLKTIIPSINGIKMYSNTNSPGCWCIRNLYKINNRGHYKTCLINTKVSLPFGRAKVLPPTDKLLCNYTKGNGHSMSSIVLSSIKGINCMTACTRMKEIDDSINGVTVFTNNKRKGCWCHKHMSSVILGSYYKTCYLTLATPKPEFNGDSRCRLSPGDGNGISEVKVGYQKGAKCIDACIQMKEFDPTINGVTLYSSPHLPGCWCERQMTRINPKKRYKACFLATKSLR